MVSACVSVVHEAVPLQTAPSEVRPLVQEVLACHLLEEIDPGWAAGKVVAAGASAAAAGAVGACQIANDTYASQDAVELAPANYPVFSAILMTSDEQRASAVGKMAGMLRKRAQSLPNLAGGTLEILTDVTAALDWAEAEAGRLGRQLRWALLHSLPVLREWMLVLDDKTVDTYAKGEANFLPGPVTRDLVGFLKDLV